MSDTNNFVARGQIVTSAVLRCVSILTAITVCWVFVEFVMGFNWTAKEVGSHLLDLLKHLIPAAATFFFAPFLASIAWLAWPGSRPTLQGRCTAAIRFRARVARRILDRRPGSMVAKRQLSEASRTKKGIMQSNTKARSSFAIHAAALASAGVAALLVGGCTQRTIEVTSEPSGAMVWLNDMQIGRTPCETAFKFYGVYDVRVVLEGYEPLVTSREAVTPVNEWPGVDLMTAPLPIHNRVKWHFALAPAAETVDKPKAEADLVARARALREMSKPVEPVTTAQPAAGEGGPVVVPAGP